ncbi:MAG: hypothetical protein ACOCVU_05965, partial [Desulfohalobiaceae bacterium]
GALLRSGSFFASLFPLLQCLPKRTALGDRAAQNGAVDGQDQQADEDENEDSKKSEPAHV